MNINAVRGLFIVLEEEKEQLIKEIEEEGADFINKILKIIIGIITVSVIFFIIQVNKSNDAEKTNNNTAESENSVSIAEKNNSEVENTIETNSEVKSEKIKIIDIDGQGKNYRFMYENEQFTAIYTKDNWQIKNSYKINDLEDLTKVCQALIDIHPIHGSDMKSYRTAQDMANEWFQHNIAYFALPEGNNWKEHAKHVDLNPEDQGKNLIEMFETRTIN